MKMYLVGCYRGVSNLAAILTGRELECKITGVIRGGLKRPGKTFCLNLRCKNVLFKC